MKRLLFLPLLLTGCATQGVDRANENVLSEQFYASVVSVRDVELSSQVKTGVLVGGAAGVIDELDGNHEDMIAGGLAGALVGGLFTALFEGSDDAYEYTLDAGDRGEYTLVQKDKLAPETQCVKVLVSGKTTLEPAPLSQCDTSHLSNK